MRVTLVVFLTLLIPTMADICGQGWWCSSEDVTWANYCSRCPTGYTCPGQYNNCNAPFCDIDCFGVSSDLDCSNCAPKLPKPCVASTNQFKEGSDGVFYCINGGDIRGTTGSCKCTGCNPGYSGKSCQTASLCTASVDSNKDGSDGNFYCLNGGNAGGRTGSCTCNCRRGYIGANCEIGLACIATNVTSDNGSDGNLYCINGGAVEGTTGYCKCTSCNTGFGGSNCAYCTEGFTGDACSICSSGYYPQGDLCVSTYCHASNSSTDDGSDGNLFCINNGTVTGTTGDCVCTCKEGSPYFGKHCANIDSATFVTDMVSLFNAISGAPVGWLGVTNQGNNLMLNGDSTVMFGNNYKCTEGNCASSGNMLVAYNLDGSVECINDDPNRCVLDGESKHRVLYIYLTSDNYYKMLTLRALTFKDGKSGSDGGGLYLRERTTVHVSLCIFTGCHADGTFWGAGGGAIYVSGLANEWNTVNLHLWGTSFVGNEAKLGNDIHNWAEYDATIVVHDTCPPPYDRKVPTQGSLLETSGAIGGRRGKGTLRTRYSFSGE